MAKTKLQMNEKELSTLLSKGTATLNTKFSLSGGAKKNDKVILDINPTATKKSSFINVGEINKLNKNAIVQTSCSGEHFSLVLNGGRLLSINQILNLLQRKTTRVQVFAYKKNIHDIIQKILFETYVTLKEKNQQLPFFNDSVELILFRQAPRLVDEDALSTMFKYIIDAFKRTPDNPYGILADDNPKIVHKIECYSEKGEYSIGIKIKLIVGDRKEIYSSEKILTK